MKQLLVTIAIIISLGCFGQDTLYDAKWQGIKIYTTMPKPQKDTVDVIALVSDTSSLSDYVGWRKETFIPISQCLTIKCKAVRRNDILWGGETIGNITYTINAQHDNWLIEEYLLPKKYIVWKSVIINKTK